MAEGGSPAGKRNCWDPRHLRDTTGAGRRTSGLLQVQDLPRKVQDLRCFEYTTTVIVGLYRLRCPNCRLKTEQMPQLPSKAPYTKRFEDPVGRFFGRFLKRRIGHLHRLEAGR